MNLLIRTTAILLLALFTLPTLAQKRSLPNIVFIMADDLGYGHLGSYGQTKIQTPNIDRLATQGKRFTQTYSGNTVCAPCRSVLMTGRHMGHTSVRKSSGGVPILPYTSGAFGKWGIGEVGSGGEAIAQGFDEFFGYYHQVHAHSYYPDYLWHNDKKYVLPGNTARDSDGLTGDLHTQYTADEIQKKALAFIRRNQERPFFCYVPSTIPHTELLPPPDAMRVYEGRFPEPTPWIDPRGHYADQPKPRTAFAAMVTRLDRHVGQILDLLDELHLTDNTIVFFTSDNGGQTAGGPDLEFFNGNGILRNGKGSMYEGGIRVPMIVRWPGRVEAGSTSDHPWYFPDVLPTLAEIAGVSRHVPRNVDGHSVLPALIGEQAAGRKQPTHEYMYWELGAGRSMKIGLRAGDWKLVSHNPNQTPELFNLKNDPSETTNLADRRPDVLDRLIQYARQAHTPMRPQQEPPHANGWRFN
ncbi:MAG: arylsulfatase [Planctomycetota bacterium]|jgi:arylsulfatase A-like enzyme